MSRKAVVPAVAGLLAIFGAAVFLRGRSNPPSPPVPVGARQIGEYGWVVPQVEKQAYLADLERVTRQITLQPNPGKDENSVIDLSIAALAADSPMYQAGFRVNDRILKLNGSPIGTLARSVNLIHEIRACPRLTVQVQRGEKVLGYSVDFE